MTSVNIELCGNCGGEGTVIIKNAYDLSLSEEEICDVCGGDGHLEDDLEFAPRRRKQNFDDAL